VENFFSIQQNLKKLGFLRVAAHALPMEYNVMSTEKQKKSSLAVQRTQQPADLALVPCGPVCSVVYRVPGRVPVTGRQACLPEYSGTGQNERFVPPGIFLSFSLIGVLIG
jgi:hypothetical protein